MAQHSGFFDALLSDGAYDRTYSAADYCDNLATIIKTGVRYSPENDLRVTAAGGMALRVGTGRAWINGHYYHNDAAYMLNVSTAPTGSNKRIDRAVLRLDTSVNNRYVKLALKTGTAGTNPTPPALLRNGDIYEIALADIYVDAAQTVITDADIIDQRENENVCGWAASVTPSIISLLKEYSWHTTLTESTNKVAFFIPQYEADDVHILEVYTNGVLEVAGVDYTVDADVITFTYAKQIGAEILVKLYKSIDGKGLETVAQEITALQNAVAVLAGDSEAVYICNGINDNVRLSEIAQAWLNGGTDYASKRVRVIGNFGASAAYGGTGAQANPYRWLSVGQETSKNRRITFDFSNCGQISLPIAAGTFNTVFYGADAHIIGANVVVNQTGAGTRVAVFNGVGAVKAENCRFWLTCYQDSVIAYSGTFTNCRGSVANTINNAYCFLPYSDGLIRVNGGEYYAYTGDSSKQSAILGQSAANGVSVLYGVSAPTAARAGYYQTNSVLQWVGGGVLSCTDLISALPMIVVSGISNIRGTIEKSKAGVM